MAKNSAGQEIPEIPQCSCGKQNSAGECEPLTWLKIASAIDPLPVSPDELGDAYAAYRTALANDCLNAAAKAGLKLVKQPLAEFADIPLGESFEFENVKAAELERRWMAAFSRAWGTDEASSWSPEDMEKIVRDLKRGCDSTAELERRTEQLERWLNDAANEVGGCDLDSVASAIRKSRAELERQLAEAHRTHENGYRYAIEEHKRAESAERRVEELRQFALHKLTCPAHDHSRRCGYPIYDRSREPSYGCSKHFGHDGEHETLEQRHAGRIDGYERPCTCGLSALLKAEGEQSNGSR